MSLLGVFFMSITTAKRYHDFCAGHRVYGHENKCAHLHGHNYRVHFEVKGVDKHIVDQVGRVLDFSVIKDRLCQWLEDHWDHKFLMWEKDPLAAYVFDLDKEGVVRVPFNPTAENMAEYLVKKVGPFALRGTDCVLVSVEISETRKCSAVFSL